MVSIWLSPMNWDWPRTLLTVAEALDDDDDDDDPSDILYKCSLESEYYPYPSKTVSIPHLKPLPLPPFLFLPKRPVPTIWLPSRLLCDMSLMVHWLVEIHVVVVQAWGTHAEWSSMIFFDRPQYWPQFAYASVSYAMIRMRAVNQGHISPLTSV